MSLFPLPYVIPWEKGIHSILQYFVIPSKAGIHAFNLFALCHSLSLSFPRKRESMSLFPLPYVIPWEKGIHSILQYIVIPAKAGIHKALSILDYLASLCNDSLFSLCLLSCPGKRVSINLF
jgi:hypothetical protein